jgi:hypothetical protein
LVGFSGVGFLGPLAFCIINFIYLGGKISIFTPFIIDHTLSHRSSLAGVPELKIDWSFSCCISSTIGATDSGLVVLDSLGPQLPVCEISFTRWKTLTYNGT